MQNILIKKRFLYEWKDESFQKAFEGRPSYNELHLIDLKVLKMLELF